MSTLSGIAAKGEKGKPRYQSLDINNLYSKSKGDPSETNQHKNTLSRRHGMQPLGKVPSARRPANLPSLKLEYSGNDPAISLVPSGGTGWGSKPGETGLPPTASTPPPPLVTPTTSAPATAAVAISTPSISTSVVPTTIPSQSHVDKSWSSITSNSSENTPMFLAHQSPYFQQEFPSLSGDANSSASGANKIDPTHLPGPSLRPQNEGNWIQGGSRPQGQMGAGVGNQQGTVPAPGPLSLPHLPQGLDVGGGRSNLGPSGVGVGPAGPMPPAVPFQQYKLMPQFMLRHSMAAGGFPPNYQHCPPRPRFPYPPDTRFMPPSRGPPNVEQDEVTTRPIIKEEDLKVMDEIGRDTGWAAHDEIDYNQTLSFSDEEGALDDESKGKIGRHSIQSKEKRDVDRKSPETDTNSVDVNKLNQGGRQVEEDEDLLEKRRIHSEHMAITVERAKQRKEEEEKRFEESRQNAAKKLKSLEQRLRSKNGIEKEETTTSPSQNVLHGSNALMPDWEKDRSRKNSEEKDDKSPKENLESFRNTQVDNKNQFRERENVGQHGFSRQFPSNVPPRLQKQAAENRAPPYYRQGSGNITVSNLPYDNKWSSHFGGSMGMAKNYRSHQMSESDKSDNSRERDRNNYDSGFKGRERERLSESPSTDRNKEESWKGPGYYEESSISVMNSHTYDSSSKIIPEHHSEPNHFNIETESDRFYEDKGSESKPNESFKPAHSFQDEPFVERDYNQDNKLEGEIRDVSHKLDSRERLERPQRPDSRDSRASRDSRHSRDSAREDKLLGENCGHETILPWSQSTHDTEHKEDKRRKDEPETRRELHTMQSIQQHQRLIPGPITKEKLEASETKCESSRNSNLVPLIKSEVKKSENKWEIDKSSEVSWPRTPALVTQSVNTESELCTTQPLTDFKEENTSECQQLNINLDETKAAVPKTTYNEREQFETSNSHKSEVQRGGRGGHRGMRHDSRGSKTSSGSYYRGGAPTRRGERGQMSSNRRQNTGCDWIQHDPESEASDEISVSTESGKEDRRQDQDRKHLSRSPRRGLRKSDKDDRTRDGNRKQENDKNFYSGNENRRYDKKMYEHNRMGAGFEPSGVPSRRGRGASFRSKGSSTSLGRGMVDGYGPPTSKKPFSESMSSNSHDEKKPDGTSQNQTVHKENGLNEIINDEKMKLNQQQLSAGIIGNASRGGNLKSHSQNTSSRLQTKDGERRERKPRDNSGWGVRNYVKGGSGSGGEVGDEDGETTSEHEDRSCGDEKTTENLRRNYNQGMPRGNNWRQSSNRNYGREKHTTSSYDRDSSRRSGNHQSMVNGSTRFQSGKDQPVVDHSLADKKQPRPDYKEKRNNLDHIDMNNTASVVVVDDQPEVTVEEDQTVFATDNNGFQEVRSKKNVKEGNRQLKEEPQRGSKERPKHNKPPSSQSPGPPGSTVPTAKGGTRTGNLAPRFAKIKELSRQQKITQQQQTYDVSDLAKINQVLDFPSKDLTNPAPPPAVNAWDKPITATLRTSTPGLAETCNIEVADHLQSATSSQRSSPNEDKTVGKLPRESVEKALEDTSPPVQTIIFENTNYKTAPVDVAMKSKYSNQLNKNQRPDKPREKKIEEDNIGGFKSPGPDIQLQEAKADPIQMPISFNKNEDGADIKLDVFRFDSELSQLTDDKTTKSISSIQMTRSIQMTTQSSTADLQFKLDSVKRVWENPVEPSGEDTNNVATAPSYTPTFGNSVEDPSGYGKPNDSSVGDENNTSVGVYNSGQQLQNNTNTYNGSSVPNMIKPVPTSNVCEVKPQRQSAMHPHAGPLSPPTGAFTSPAQPSQHLNYQAQAQYGGIPAIPSPPTVFTQSHDQQLYQTFQINNPQVLNNQARSQFSQFAPYISQSLGQTSGFSQQSMYLHQTAPPPPTAAPAPAHPDIYSQYRLQQQFGGNQQLSTNASTMLISSSTVKPPPQPIGAIGSKAASYQTPSQPPSQLIIYSDPQMMNQNYMQNSQLVQRPASNVVPTIPPSSASYYSASTGGNAPGYFQPGNSNMHHLQAFSAQSPGGTPAGMGSFGSTLPRLFLQNPVQAAVGVVGSRVQSTVHRSNSPAPPRATTSSPRINKMSQRQPSS